jgi:hypothetical protein
MGLPARPADELKRRDNLSHLRKERVMGDEPRLVLEGGHGNHAVDGGALHVVSAGAGTQATHERAKELCPALGKRQEPKVTDHLRYGALLRRVIRKLVVKLVEREDRECHFVRIAERGEISVYGLMKRRGAVDQVGDDVGVEEVARHTLGVGSAS